MPRYRIKTRPKIFKDKGRAFRTTYRVEDIELPGKPKRERGQRIKRIG